MTTKATKTLFALINGAVQIHGGLEHLPGQYTVNGTVRWAVDGPLVNTGLADDVFVREYLATGVCDEAYERLHGPLPADVLHRLACLLDGCTDCGAAVETRVECLECAPGDFRCSACHAAHERVAHARAERVDLPCCPECGMEIEAVSWRGLDRPVALPCNCDVSPRVRRLALLAGVDDIDCPEGGSCTHPDGCAGCRGFAIGATGCAYQR